MNEWEVTEHKYVDDKISRYRPAQLSDAQKAGLKALQETLRTVSARLPGFSFKSTPKSNVVWIVMMRANNGTQEAVSSAKARIDILADAMTMPREAFQARLENFLSQNGFDLEGG